MSFSERKRSATTPAFLLGRFRLSSPSPAALRLPWQRLLLALGTGNPRYLLSVRTAALRLLPSSAPAAQRLACQIVRELLPREVPKVGWLLLLFAVVCCC